VTRTSYTATGQVQAVTGANGNLTTNSYDANDRLASVTDPLSRVTSKCSPDERSDIRVLTCEHTPAGRYAIAGEAHENAMRHPGSCPTLAIARRTFVDIARPILPQQAAAHVEMERRMRPVANARYQAVFHRIVMNVIRVPDKIVLVTDGVFPVTSLPVAPVSDHPGMISRISLRSSGLLAVR
jgi:YD repeat-containing protein